MFLKLLTRIFGSKNERELKKLAPIVDSVNLLEPKMQAMTNDQLTTQLDLFRTRFKKGETLNQLLPEAFATAREGAVRILGIRPYDVQILGGIVLHKGRIAEMKTGEGKTLVATMPVYLNAIAGRGVHVVTVNDYLAVRDTEWMGKLYSFLGMTVGSLIQGLNDQDRKKAYNSDVTYGTNNEFGFDYLRDNMKFDGASLVQRELYFSIVDEVDSILIDEARTPLIISGSSKKSTDLYEKINNVIYLLNADSDYKMDEKTRSVVLTDLGASHVEEALEIQNIYDSAHVEILHHINQALKAHTLFKLDIDYIVKNGEVIIVDEFTGRLMPGRRYSEGLHQALEAKEKVKIENENQTFATVTFQNYFRMYEKLAGMTGTAYTEAAEFKKIYDLEVGVIPTNKPMIRKDLSDLIYKKRKNKFQAILRDIKHLNRKGQPVLVGTVSIDSSEQLSKKLKKDGIKHFVLNAKNHEKEAEIIALAGQKHSVTISTNMAGRGTDIVLGDGVTDLGGLYIIGTERHESRRIDNQLRGRSGRQGDPGSSRFYLSLEDDLLRIFGGEKITSIMEHLGMSDGEPIEHKLVSRSIENAQSKVEANNFDIRKHLLKYDDVLNQQREVIYRQRRNLLSGQDLRTTIEDIMMEIANEIAKNNYDQLILSKDSNLQEISDTILQYFNFEIYELTEDDTIELTCDSLSKIIYNAAYSYYIKKESALGSENLRQLERVIMLQIVDNLWKDHLLNMDHLKEGIGLRGYAQQDPLLVYKREGFNMFREMISLIRSETIKVLFRIETNASKILDFSKDREKKDSKLIFSSNTSPAIKKKTIIRDGVKIGRNLPCPCGSDKKYKKCCGQ